MHSLYNLASGPLAWVAFFAFLWRQRLSDRPDAGVSGSKREFYFHVYELALQSAVDPALDHPLCHGQLASPAVAHRGDLRLSYLFARRTDFS